MIILADSIPFDYVGPHSLPADSGACQSVPSSWGGMSPSSSYTISDLQVRAWARWPQDRDDDDDDYDDDDMQVRAGAKRHQDRGRGGRGQGGVPLASGAHQVRNVSQNITCPYSSETP